MTYNGKPREAVSFCWWWLHSAQPFGR